MIARRWAFIALAVMVACRSGAPAPPAGGLPQGRPWVALYDPARDLGPLFHDVQVAGIFADSKTLVDARPLLSPSATVLRYASERGTPGFSLRAFMAQHFQLPRPAGEGFHSDTSQTMEQHIRALWPVLTRAPDSAGPHSSLIPLPEAYVVPGGRFREVYYWDSYFTMLGLIKSDRTDLVENMLDNFAHLIKTVGHIPNGNRTYYLSRSQPPFFGAMVGLYAAAADTTRALRYLDALEAEHAFWMDSGEGLPAGGAYRRVVRIRCPDRSSSSPPVPFLASSPPGPLSTTWRGGTTPESSFPLSRRERGSGGEVTEWRGGTTPESSFPLSRRERGPGGEVTDWRGGTQSGFPLSRRERGPGGEDGVVERGSGGEVNAWRGGTQWREGTNRACGPVLNRYWDDRPEPRPESYREDYELGQRLPEGRRQEFYRNVRATAESGWDFSSRWMRDPKDLRTLETTDLVPVDLNSLLYHTERMIAALRAFRGRPGDAEVAERFLRTAEDRRQALLALAYDSASGFFYDVRWRSGERVVDRPTLAAAAPLYFGLATAEQGSAVAVRLERDFLKPGGFVTSLIASGQQWDAPNGWPPLQWLAIEGVRRYGRTDLATAARDRWVALNRRTYQSTGKMMEKYDVVDLHRRAAGGEYPTQDGFGWSNGVALALEALRP